MDVAKSKIPASLLEKEGSLTEVERAYLRTHVDHGLEIVRESPDVDNRVLDMIATHHERFDGTGYPRGLKGNQIPVFGRIGGIVDSYSAMTRDRPYARAMPPFDAMRELTALSDKHFQSEMVEQFIQAVGVFPAGTLVELNTGEIAIVLKEHRTSRLQPEIAVVLDSKKQPLAEIRIIDLIEQQGSTPTMWIERGAEPGAYDIDAKKFFL
jgi:HD-GYP domain-containing protein (c-di-GMP phosphodiesterase class II)